MLDIIKVASSLMLDLFTSASSFAFYRVWEHVLFPDFFPLLCLRLKVGTMILHHVWWMVILLDLFLAFMLTSRAYMGVIDQEICCINLVVSSSWKEVISDGTQRDNMEYQEWHHCATAPKEIEESSIGLIMIQHFEELHSQMQGVTCKIIDRNCFRYFLQEVCTVCRDLHIDSLHVANIWFHSASGCLFPLKWRACITSMPAWKYRHAS